MELTTKQIQEIDNRLKKDGVKYWDIRIEMLDHVVTDIEENSRTEDFKMELTNSLMRAGWLGELVKVNAEGWQNTNKKYRKEYHKEFINFFKNSKNIFILLIFISFLYFASEYLTLKLFKKLNFILLIISAIPFFFLAIKQLFKKYGKSVNLDYGTFYFSFALLMINLPLQLLKYTSETNQKILLLIFIPIYFIATYSGYRIYKKAISKVEKMRKQLLS